MFALENWIVSKLNWWVAPVYASTVQRIILAMLFRVQFCHIFTSALYSILIVVLNWVPNPEFMTHFPEAVACERSWKAFWYPTDCVISDQYNDCNICLLSLSKYLWKQRGGLQYTDTLWGWEGIGTNHVQWNRQDVTPEAVTYIKQLQWTCCPN